MNFSSARNVCFKVIADDKDFRSPKQSLYFIRLMSKMPEEKMADTSSSSRQDDIIKRKDTDLEWERAWGDSSQAQTRGTRSKLNNRIDDKREFAIRS